MLKEKQILKLAGHVSNQEELIVIVGQPWTSLDILGHPWTAWIVGLRNYLLYTFILMKEIL
jgi:hypothetical protein